MARPAPQRAYGQNIPLINVFPEPEISDTVPTSSDVNFPLGQIWVNKVTGALYGLSRIVAGAADWEALGGSASDVNTLTGNSGGAVPPAGGTINIVGSGTLAVAGNPGTSTLTISDSSTAAETLTGNSGGAVTPTADNINIVGTGSITVVGNPGTSTLTITPSTSTSETLTGNSGGVVSATANNINVVGTGSITVVGNPGTSTLTVQSTGGLSETLTGNTGGAVGPTAGNITLVGSGGVAVTGNPGTSTLTITAAGGSAYPVTPYTVGPVNEADYQTIAAAITAATATGGTIYIQQGTYTEDLTLVAGVNFRGNCQERVTIVGSHVPPASGAVSFENLSMSDADSIIKLAGASAANFNFNNCNLAITTAGSIMAIDSPSGTFEFWNCDNEGTVADSICTSATSTATINIWNSKLGAGATAYTNTGGTTNIYNSVIQCPITNTGASTMLISNTKLSALLTTGGSASTVMNGSSIELITTDCIVHGSTGILHVINAFLNTDGTYAISGTGAGAVKLGNITYALTDDIDPGLPSVSGFPVQAYSFKTALNQATNMLYDATGITAEGSDANIDITLTPKGTGATKPMTDLICAGNITMSTAGDKLSVVGGAATDFIGQVTLAAGTALVANTSITANDRIFLCRSAVNGSTTLGDLSVIINAGADFSVHAWNPAAPGTDEAGDTSIVDYFIVRQL